MHRSGRQVNVVEHLMKAGEWKMPRGKGQGHIKKGGEFKMSLADSLSDSDRSRRVKFE